MKKLLLVVCFLAIAGLASANNPCSNGFTIVNNPNTTNGTIFTPGVAVWGAGNDGCTIGGFNFQSWQVAANTGYTGSQNLTVTVGAVGGTLLIGTNMNAALGQDIELEYKLTPGANFMGMSVGGSGGVNEIICSTQMVINGAGAGVCSGVLLANFSVAGGTSGGSAIAPSPSGVNWVFKDISGSSEIDQTAAVPEPMTFGLMGAGLVGLGLLRRRFRK